MLLLLVAAMQSARAEPVHSLGRLEREALDEALTQLGLSIDPSPAGKIVGRVYVVNQDVWSRNDWRFQLLNMFHRTTRPEIIARELLLSPGQLWDEALADESVRNLYTNPPLFFSDGTLFAAPQVSAIVAMVPVASAVPGTVDLLAVTRDVWSLRANTQFEFQRDTLTTLRTSISENNLFGWRKHLAAGFELDLGRYGFGPTYFDPNVAGTRLTLLAKGTAWYGREAESYEGHNELFSLRYPLYALARRWGAGVDVSHQDAIVRSFCDNRICTDDVAGTTVPLAYRFRTFGVDANAVRSFGETILHRLTAGYRVFRQRPTVVEGFPPDPALADAFLTEWAPLPETRSEPYLRYQLFTARYGIYRDFDTFDLRETRRLGPLLSLEIGAGLSALGADFVAYPMAATASWAVAPGGSAFGLAQLQVAGRMRSSELIDQRLSAVLYVASPTIARAARVVASATTDAVRADTYRTRFFMGGETGLRGYEVGEFRGTVAASFHVEVRTAPVALVSQRFGALVFYDVGDAAESYGALVPRHDFGVGLRWLIPQLNASVVRIDWAIATDAGPFTRPGLPGRISAGFMQSFWLLDSPKGYLPTF